MGVGGGGGDGGWWAGGGLRNILLINLDIHV